eukprot:1946990-Lingulodinium_polyedra.AAC.1
MQSGAHMEATNERGETRAAVARLAALVSRRSPQAMYACCLATHTCAPLRTPLAQRGPTEIGR